MIKIKNKILYNENFLLVLSLISSLILSIMSSNTIIKMYNAIISIIIFCLIMYFFEKAKNRKKREDIKDYKSGKVFSGTCNFIII